MYSGGYVSRWRWTPWFIRSFKLCRGFAAAADCGASNIKAVRVFVLDVGRGPLNAGLAILQRLRSLMIGERLLRDVAVSHSHQPLLRFLLLPLLVRDLTPERNRSCSRQEHIAGCGFVEEKGGYTEKHKAGGDRKSESICRAEHTVAQLLPYS